MKRKKITAKDLKVGDTIRFFGSKRNWLVEKAVTSYVGEGMHVMRFISEEQMEKFMNGQ